MEQETSQPKKDYLLPASILIAALLISGALVYNVGKKETSTAGDTADLLSKIDLKEVVFLGNPKAPVTLIQYSDYQCPFCGRFFEETELALRSEYIQTDKVRTVYKDLAFLGPESVAAAGAANCAADQNKFWEYHDALFRTEIEEDKNDDGVLNGSSENSGNLTRELFLQIAGNLGLNVSQFISCLDSKKYQAKIEKDIAEARIVIPLPSTPTVFVNDKMIQGALPYNVFKEAIEKEL